MDRPKLEVTDVFAATAKLSRTTQRVDIHRAAARHHRHRSAPDSRSGRSMPDACRMPVYWLCGVRGYRSRDSGLGSGPELENLFGGDKGKAQAAVPQGRKYRGAGQGADRPL
jgi:hypothetical protein